MLVISIHSPRSSATAVGSAITRVMARSRPVAPFTVPRPRHAASARSNGTTLRIRAERRSGNGNFMSRGGAESAEDPARSWRRQAECQPRMDFGACIRARAPLTGRDLADESLGRVDELVHREAELLVQPLVRRARTEA